MHTGPVSGTFRDGGHALTIPCPKCKQQKIREYEWESDDGAYTDYKYKCTACDHTWWVEGVDS